MTSYEELNRLWQKEALMLSGTERCTEIAMLRWQLHEKTIQLKKLTADIEELRKRNAELEKMKAPEEETCMGCITGEPNQLAHMDPGGCLYFPEEYEDEDEEEEEEEEEDSE